ncbi:MAG: ABC transporter permease subunit [Deltaproteobacteria bacterium]|nr:ABC transporter permease subunit [Deltaproteobacteria bacterium]
MSEQALQRGVGETFVYDGSVARRVSADQFELHTVEFTADEPIQVCDGAAIVAVDLSETPTGPVEASVDERGVLRVTRLTRTRNLLTGKDRIDTETGQLRLRPSHSAGLPRWLLLHGGGNSAIAVWQDGRAMRVDVSNLEKPKIAEEVDLSAGTGAHLTELAWLNGKNTLIVGDSSGSVRAWFRVPAPSMSTADGMRLLPAHDLGTGPAAVTALGSSARTRSLAVGYADGTLRIFNVTSGRLLAESRSGSSRPVSVVALAPNDDSLVAWDGELLAATLDAPHPEASLGALLRPVWYEGYAGPEHSWQSSSGTDEFEPKLGLWPLVFGTLKATFYSMLFGVPIALMAAIYTSEFLRPEVKSIVKPAIELMASLPSVVLGFLAALVFAPVIERIVPEFLAALVTVPFVLLLCAHLWQLFPQGVRAGMQGRRFVLSGVAIVFGLSVAMVVGPLAERWLFLGDVKLWLDGHGGDATGGWLILTLPVSALASVLVAGRAERMERLLPGATAAQSLLRFLLLSLLSVAAALAAAEALSFAGLDLRGGFLGTYIQRNALIVGFVMGFAVVPIIYTIAEDALSSIPDNLRAGSLALGATPWQTAVRIVVPTAMSGLFSAVMVGLGRAVGETMVVLMAAGNTPVLQWNVFNGFRTLSANIAVELPEAVRNSTHYRTLFLAALALFVMTFVLNTAAELVRSRFRKRAYQL